VQRHAMNKRSCSARCRDPASFDLRATWLTMRRIFDRVSEALELLGHLCAAGRPAGQRRSPALRTSLPFFPIGASVSISSLL
jgi:hypothetical protein